MIADTAEKQGICGLAYGDCSNMPDDLVSLEELGQFEVAEDEADPRGWELIGRDGEEIGEIEDLIVSPSTRKAYFAVVDCGNWLEEKRFSVPLKGLTFNEDDHRAYGSYDKTQFQNAPEYLGPGRNYVPQYNYWRDLG